MLGLSDDNASWRWTYYLMSLCWDLTQGTVLKLDDTKAYSSVNEESKLRRNMLIMGSSYMQPVFPVKLQVAKLAQHFRKLAPQILWKCVKVMLFLVDWTNFQPWRAIILVQQLPQFGKFCRIGPSSKTLEGTLHASYLPYQVLRVLL